MISRGNPGTDHETVGISHLALLDPIIADIAAVTFHPPGRIRRSSTPTAASRRRNPAPRTTADVEKLLDNRRAAPLPRSRKLRRAQSNSCSPTTPPARPITVTVGPAGFPRSSSTVGADHPDTLYARNILAHWRGQAGDAAGAVAEYEALLADQQRVLGPDHPDTLNTRDNLTHWRGKTGDQPSLPLPFAAAGPPEDAPELLRPAALVAAGALAALLLALLVFTVMRMSTRDDSGTPSTITSTVTQTVPVTQAPQTITETAPPSTVTATVTTTVTVPPTPATVTETVSPTTIPAR